MWLRSLIEFLAALYKKFKGRVCYQKIFCSRKMSPFSIKTALIYCSMTHWLVVTTLYGVSTDFAYSEMQPQTLLQVYLTPSYALFLCALRLDFDASCFPHCSQGWCWARSLLRIKYILATCASIKQKLRVKYIWLLTFVTYSSLQVPISPCLLSIVILRWYLFWGVWGVVFIFYICTDKPLFQVQL